MPPEIATPRLVLRPIGEPGVQAACDLLWQPDVRRYLCDDALVPRSLVESWVAESNDPASSTELWAISTPDRDVAGLAGLVGLRSPDARLLQFRAIGWRSLELIVALHPDHRHCGLATEAVLALADHARGNPVTFALLGCVDAPNEPSHRLMQRCGFHELGDMPGRTQPVIVYELPL